MAAAFIPTSYTPDAAERTSRTTKRAAYPPTKASQANPTPSKLPETKRSARRPKRSAALPPKTMAGKEATIPTERATPKGPGERSRKRLRSASRTAKAPQIRPKAPKAPNSKARNLLCLVAHLLPGVYAVFHVGDVRVAHLLDGLRHQSATAPRAQRTTIRDSSSGSFSAAWYSRRPRGIRTAPGMCPTSHSSG